MMRHVNDDRWKQPSPLNLTSQSSVGLFLPSSLLAEKTKKKGNMHKIWERLVEIQAVPNQKGK